ncbi:helix-turn-helix domain-containing protein [Streptomyces sp. NPDC049687]|uniref:AraC-like ligand-binding domain-containing protein n=1 Tax=Streptomyces sp. NPDC049687 TaxID=3365596 RepID=UPI003790D2B9
MPNSFQVDTANRPAAERTEYWRSSVCDQFVPLAVRPTLVELHGRVAGASIAETRLRRIRASQHVFERRPSDIRTGDPEVLHVLSMDHGHSCHMEQDGRTTILKPGDLVLYDSSRPFRFATSGAFQFTIGLLPKRLLPLPEKVLADRTTRATPPADGVGAALGALLTSLAGGSAAHSDPSQQVAIQHALVSLCVAFMSDEGAMGSPPSVHLSLAKSFIVRHLGESTLAPADVAVACGVSLSYLHRLFATEGTTIVGYLREQRLKGAHRDLTTSLVDEPVLLVGRRWGIPDPAHFSRAFKKRFGVTPGEARRFARTPPVIRR